MARGSEDNYKKTLFAVKALELTYFRRTNDSSVIAIDAGGSMGVGGATSVLECFKLGNYDSIFRTLVSASSRWMFQFGDPQ